MNTIRVSNSLDPDQAQHFVGPDPRPNCLQMLSADDTCKQRGRGIQKGELGLVVLSSAAISRIRLQVRISQLEY